MASALWISKLSVVSSVKYIEFLIAMFESYVRQNVTECSIVRVILLTTRLCQCLGLVTLRLTAGICVNKRK